MKRDISSGLIFILLVGMLITGCVPIRSTLGKEQVISKRLNSDGQAAEKIVGVPTEHHWMMLVAPHGPELDYVNSETWRFYLVGADGQRESLRFLQQRGGSMPWDIIAPLPNTNLWIGVIYTGSVKSIERGHFDYRVIRFSSKNIISEETLDYPEYGKFHFDSEKHILIYKMKGESRSYDPLGKSDLH